MLKSKIKTTEKHEHEPLTQKKTSNKTTTKKNFTRAKFVSIRFYLLSFHLIQFIKAILPYVALLSCWLAAFKSLHICIKTHRRLKRIVARHKTNYLPGVTHDKRKTRGARVRGRDREEKNLQS